MRPTLDDVLEFIATHTGEVTGMDVANRFPVESKEYGRQRYTSGLIARCRKLGYISDCDRCNHCNRALTRSRRNVPLVLTTKGMLYLDDLTRPLQQ